MDTGRIGAIAETAIAAEAAQLGFTVLRPIAGGLRYDLAFEIGGRFIRVQCKSARCHRDAVVVKAMTSRRVAGGGYRRGTYSPDEIDVVAAYCPEVGRCFAVPISLFGTSGQFWLRLSPAQNGQRAGLHFADEFSLGAIAQLEEHLHGMQGVGGSSPPSSTGSPAAMGAAEPTIVGAHEFRNRFGWYMERAGRGEEMVVTHRGKPHLRLSAVTPALDLAA